MDQQAIDQASQSVESSEHAGTLSDCQPPAGVQFKGKDCRPFAYFDYKLLSAITEKGIDEADAVVIVAYALTHTSQEEIGAIWRKSNADAQELLADALAWSGSMNLQDFAKFLEDVTASITEFVDMSGTGEGDESGESGTEGNAQQPAS